jgi:signal peptidase
MGHPGYRAVLSGLLLLFLAVGIWILLGPIQLGGRVAYVIIDGNSMEPGFTLGDLALMRGQASYQIGDAVTYENAEMGRYVFHRIVNIDQEHFILQGDNNDWRDSYRPTQDEIVGKLWIRLPKFGKLVQWARQPLILALGCGLFGGIMMTSLLLGSPKQGKRKKNNSFGMEDVLQIGLYVSAVLAAIFLGLSIFAFTRPLLRSEETFQYQQDGLFFYSATATPGVYEGDIVRTGDPLFPKLGCVMNVGLAYNLAGVGVQGVAGSRQLFARILDEQSGWQRVIPLEAETPFIGNSYFSNAQLDLCQVQTMVSSMEQQTGMHPSTYTLEVVAQSNFAGTLNGNPIFDSFDATMVFKFDKVHFYLVSEITPGEPMQVTKPGLSGGQVQVSNTVSVLGFDLSVQTIRILSMLGFVFSLGSTLAIGFYFLQGFKLGPNALIRLKYGGLIMDARGLEFQQNLPLVEVASIDDLARLAERQNTLITHMEINSLHIYMLQCNGAVYRYVLQTEQEDMAYLNPPSRQFPPVRAREDIYIDAKPVDGISYDEYGAYQEQKEPEIAAFPRNRR